MLARAFLEQEKVVLLAGWMPKGLAFLEQEKVVLLAGWMPKVLAFLGKFQIGDLLYYFLGNCRCLQTKEGQVIGSDLGEQMIAS